MDQATAFEDILGRLASIVPTVGSPYPRRRALSPPLEDVFETQAVESVPQFPSRPLLIPITEDGGPLKVKPDMSHVYVTQNHPFMKWRYSEATLLKLRTRKVVFRIEEPVDPEILPFFREMLERQRARNVLKYEDSELTSSISGKNELRDEANDPCLTKKLHEESRRLVSTDLSMKTASEDSKSPSMSKKPFEKHSEKPHNAPHDDIASTPLKQISNSPTITSNGQVKVEKTLSFQPRWDSPKAKENIGGSFQTPVGQSPASRLAIFLQPLHDLVKANDAFVTNSTLEVSHYVQFDPAEDPFGNGEQSKESRSHTEQNFKFGDHQSRIQSLKSNEAKLPVPTPASSLEEEEVSHENNSNADLKIKEYLQQLVQQCYSPAPQKIHPDESQSTIHDSNITNIKDNNDNSDFANGDRSTVQTGDFCRHVGDFDSPSRQKSCYDCESQHTNGISQVKTDSNQFGTQSRGTLSAGHAAHQMVTGTVDYSDTNPVIQAETNTRQSSAEPLTTANDHKAEVLATEVQSQPVNSEPTQSSLVGTLRDLMQDSDRGVEIWRGSSEERVARPSGQRAKSAYAKKKTSPKESIVYYLGPATENQHVFDADDTALLHNAPPSRPLTPAQRKYRDDEVAKARFAALAAKYGIRAIFAHLPPKSNFKYNVKSSEGANSQSSANNKGQVGAAGSGSGKSADEVDLMKFD